MARSQAEHKKALADYQQAVKDAVESVLDACTENNVLDCDKLDTAINEYVDNHHQVIDFDNAEETLRYSSNACAGLMIWSGKQTDEFPLTMLATAAFAADIAAAVQDAISQRQ